MGELFHSIVPGSMTFLLVGLIIGLGLLYRTGTSRWGRRWLVALVAMYWVLSLPIGSGGIGHLLSAGFHPLASREAARGATAVVVLDGGTMRTAAEGGIVQNVNRPSALRAIEAARVYRMLDHPLVVVSGGAYQSGPEWSSEGQAICEELVRAGVPPDRILLDPTSRSTREHALNVPRILRERGVSRFVLVTSPTHMRRAVLAFRACGADVVPSIAALWGEPGPAPFWRQFWPSVEALDVGEAAIHDMAGLVYYGIRGWL